MIAYFQNRVIWYFGSSLILLAFLVPLLAAVNKEDPNQQKLSGSLLTQASAPSVVVAVALQKTVPLYREFIGRTDSNATVDIRARIEGILEKRYFEEGKPVKKDQVLYTIDSRMYQARLQSAQAQLAKAKADLKLAREQVSVRTAEATLAQAKAKLVKAQQDVVRLRPLAKENAVPQQDLDAAVAQEQVAVAEVQARDAELINSKLLEKIKVEQAEAAVKAAQASVTEAELNLSYCTIRSPIDGLIGRNQVSIGNLVGRGEPTLLATVSSLDPIQIDFAITENDYLRLVQRGYAKTDANKQEERSEIEMILSDESHFPHKGKFLLADRAVDIQTGTLNLVAEFPNPDNWLRPNQFSRIRLSVENVENALLIPQRAIMEQQSAKIVFVVDAKNQVVLRTVTLGERFENMIIVTQGLKAGEKVIVEGQLKTRPGSVVAPTDKPLTVEAEGR